MLMNAHSTAVMTILGRVVGNTMTNVRAANLKLIGRATYLAKTHIDDIIRRAKIQGCSSIDYSDANALLFDTMEWLDQNDRSQESPVPLTIVRAIQGL
jgi:N-acetylmuramic acid 6-phosphate (MurNAc-6-P) etherase